MEQFTKEELQEIEKVFDINASIYLQEAANVVRIFSKLPDGESKDKLLHKLAKDIYNSYNTHRSISEKAHLLMNDVNIKC